MPKKLGLVFWAQYRGLNDLNQKMVKFCNWLCFEPCIHHVYYACELYCIASMAWQWVILKLHKYDDDKVVFLSFIYLFSPDEEQIEWL